MYNILYNMHPVKNISALYYPKIWGKILYETQHNII